MFQEVLESSSNEMKTAKQQLSTMGEEKRHSLLERLKLHLDNTHNKNNAKNLDVMNIESGLTPAAIQDGEGTTIINWSTLCGWKLGLANYQRPDKLTANYKDICKICLRDSRKEAKLAMKQNHEVNTDDDSSKSTSSASNST